MRVRVRRVLAQPAVELDRRPQGPGNESERAQQELPPMHLGVNVRTIA
jgi:hypothetical protein